jgi:hypothetical protein
VSGQTFPMDSPETLAVQVEGGVEVIIKIEMGVLSINVTAPGVIDPTIFTVDEDGDAKVSFFANGRQQVGSDIHQGPGAIVADGAVCGYNSKHTMDGVPATRIIDCGPVGYVAACEACAVFYAKMGAKNG